MFRRLFVAALVALCAVAALGKENQGEDLAPDASLRVGVKHRPDDCTRKSKKGDTLEMHYTGTLYKDGSKFDSSHDRNQPFSFTLGMGQVRALWCGVSLFPLSLLSFRQDSPPFHSHPHR